MEAGEFASRLQVLATAPKLEREQLSRSLQHDLHDLDSADLGDLLGLCENALESNCARAAKKLVMRACERRRDLRVERLVSGGVTLPTLLRLAQHAEFLDLPPAPALAERLVAALLSWQPPHGGDGGRLVLNAVRHFGLAGQLSEAAAEALLNHAVGVSTGRFTARQVIDAGNVLPEWRPLILRLLLAGAGASGAVITSRGLVRVAQDWGAHEDPAVFAQLRQHLDGEAGCGQQDHDAAESNAGWDPTLPTLELGGHRVVLVDGRPDGEAAFAAAVDAAGARLSKGEALQVGLDTEWEDPRPLSLIQLAVSVGGAEEVEVFLVDMLAPPSRAVLECCRRLLRVAPGSPHEVFVFSAHEDRRRLGVAGVLPRLAGEDGAEAGGQKEDGVKDLGWVDLQQCPWGLGASPGLRAVVKQQLGANFDKRLQRSNWDRRPLSQEQLEYAALDASVLLRLQGHRRGRDPAPSAGPVGAGMAPAADPAPRELSLEEERARWREHRARQMAAAAESSPTPDPAGLVPDSAGRSPNSDLRFVLPSSLGKLMRKMRGLGLDTLILGDGASTSQLARAALGEARVILTRSRKLQLPADAAKRVYILRSETSEEQLREVIDVFGVEVDPNSLCGRCVRCNAWDWQFATRDDVRGNPQINAKTLDAFAEFWVCGGCGKIFWEGSLFERAVSYFRTFMPGEGADACDDHEAEASSAAAGSSTGSRSGTAALHDKYREMEAQGFSAQRIRSQMVRDGEIAPPAKRGGTAASEDTADEDAAGPSAATSPPAAPDRGEGREARARGLQTSEAPSTASSVAARVQSAFASLVAAGVDPNEAAASAMRLVAGSSPRSGGAPAAPS